MKTVYDFARMCMRDEEFNRGGIPKNERKYFDEIGFEYTVKDGCIHRYSDDAEAFFRAMCTLMELNRKYKKIAE